MKVAGSYPAGSTIHLVFNWKTGGIINLKHTFMEGIDLITIVMIVSGFLTGYFIMPYLLGLVVKKSRRK